MLARYIERTPAHILIRYVIVADIAIIGLILWGLV